MLQWDQGKFLKGNWYILKTNPIKKILQNASTRFLCQLWQDLGETGRKLGVRLQEHSTECESKTKRAFTRSQRSATLAEINKSTVTDHANQENRTINWSKATVIDREPDCRTRLIKEAIYICKEDAQSVNRDEGSYQLSHAYDHFLGTSSSSSNSRRAKNRKN